VEALLWAALANAVLAGMLAVLAALLGRLFQRRPALVHAFWLLVLLKLITPPLLRPGLPWSAVEESPTLAGLPGAEPAPECPVRRLAPIVPAEVVVEPEAEADEPAPPGLVWSWEAAVLAAWLAGALGYWLLAGCRVVRLYRLLGAVPGAPVELQHRVAALAARLGLVRPVRVWLVPGSAPVPPLVVAVLGRPQLLLPAGLWQSLDAAQRDTLLLHELAHLRRGDHLVRWLELLVLGLYWWNPVAWWASRRLRQAEELCCDAWVVWAEPDSAGDYATALVETVAYLSKLPRRPSLAVVSAASPVVELERRLRMILAARTPRRQSRPVGAELVLTGLALLPLMPTLARTEPPTPVTLADASDPASNTSGLIAGSRSCVTCHKATACAAQRVGELPTTHADIVRLLDEVNAQKARLRQAEEKLRQAVARFEKANVKPDARATPWGNPRLKSLDQKLERLLKEVEQLRRELRPDRSQGKKPGGGKEGLHINRRAFRIPIRVSEERRPEVREVVLFVSRDQGQTWETHSRVKPDKDGFDFAATSDGLYYFTVAVIDQQGRQDPPDISRAPVGMQVVVDTIAPGVKLGAGPVKDGEVTLEWVVSDSNLDLSTLRLEIRQAGGEWKPLPVNQAASGSFTVTPPGPAWEVRLTVGDRAGNVGMARLERPSKVQRRG
jgi:beta-lactamase regulating signal transducer with metallopeptidase domain